MNKEKLRRSIKFSFTIAVITFVLAAIFSVISSSIMSGVSWVIGLLIVFIIVLIGVLFDILGIAATAAKEAPLHAMASERVDGAREAVLLVRNADKFASFCNDVIGDISGIVSGTTSAVVVIQLARIFDAPDNSSTFIIISVILTSFVAAVTVGGKAVGKFFAIHSSTQVIMLAGKVIRFIETKLKIPIFKNYNS